jgi:glycosyltransferase 2 family protein
MASEDLYMRIKFTHVQLIIGLLILGILFFTVKISDLKLLSSNILSWRGLAVVWLALVTVLPRAWRWHLLMNDGKSENRVSFANSVRFQFVGSALNLIFPAGGGDVAKSYFGFKWTGIKERMFTVSLFDKIVAISSLSALSIFAYLTSFHAEFIVAALLASIPFLMIKYFYLLNKIKWISRFQNVVEKKVKMDFQTLHQNLNFSGPTVGVAFLLSIVAWVADYFLLYECLQLMDIQIPLSLTMENGPLLTLGRLFPFTLNGLGTDEALMIFLFNYRMPGLAQNSILASAIFYRLVMLIIPAIPGLYYIYFFKNHQNSAS